MKELLKLTKTNRNIPNKYKSNYLDIRVVNQLTMQKALEVSDLK